MRCLPVLSLVALSLTACEGLEPNDGARPPGAPPAANAPDDTGFNDDAPSAPGDATPARPSTYVPELPDVPLNYTTPPPTWASAFLAPLDNTPLDNPVTDSGATLGRVLFWDTLLSATETVSCGSCHAPDAGYSDDVPFSMGHDGGLTGRKSMPLVNVRYYRNGRMFWDERADTLEDQVLMPIQDSVEMGLTLDELEGRVASEPYYEELFFNAFGSTDVDAERVSLALSQYVRSMTSFSSPYDEGRASTPDPRQPFGNFTAQENRGKEIFFGIGVAGGGPLCAGCHMADGAPGQPPGGVSFAAPGPRVNGLPDPNDLGVGDETGNPAQNNAFKSPSLRNVALRAPYMHDGRFQTLGQVVDFYDRGIAPLPNLDPLLRAPGGAPGPGGGVTPRRLNLSPADRAALIAFLETLTDDAFVEDPRFSDPFVP